MSVSVLHNRLKIIILLGALLASGCARAESCGDESMRSRIGSVLSRADERHPVHVTFRSAAPGVVMPGTLVTQYPDTMTIVLQHEFARLAVRPDGFRVLLWFKRRPATLVVPYAAISAMWDDGVLACGS